MVKRLPTWIQHQTSAQKIWLSVNNEAENLRLKIVFENPYQNVFFNIEAVGPIQKRILINCGSVDWKSFWNVEVVGWFHDDVLLLRIILIRWNVSIDFETLCMSMYVLGTRVDNTLKNDFWLQDEQPNTGKTNLFEI